MNFVDRQVPDGASTPAPGKPIVAVVIHNTVGNSPVMPRRGASWQWLIDRDGTIYRDVDEDGQCAHHVASTDEWRPPWVVFAPARLQPLSDVNYCAIGIELVSLAGHPNGLPAGYPPYTDAQYAAFRELAADIVARRGALPFVGHGQMQLDRTDPVGFDWHRAGLGDPTDAGRFYLGDDMATVAELEAQIAQLNGINTTLAEQRDNCEALKQQVEHDLSQQIGALNDRIAELQAAGAGAPRKVAQITFTDGATQDVAA